jgi:hypothetical protein
MSPEGAEMHEVLQCGAEEIIARLGLLEMLRGYGRAEVVGSVALDLVVRRDTDIHLLLGPGAGGAVGAADAAAARGSVKFGIDRYPGPSGERSHFRPEAAEKRHTDRTGTHPGSGLRGGEFLAIPQEGFDTNAPNDC